MAKLPLLLVRPSTAVQKALAENSVIYRSHKPKACFKDLLCMDLSSSMVPVCLIDGEDNSKSLFNLRLK